MKGQCNYRTPSGDRCPLKAVKRSAKLPYTGKRGYCTRHLEELQRVK